MNDFLQQVTVNVLDNQPLAVDTFTKYSTHGLDAGSDHAWVDDTGLHMWILCFRIGGLGIMVSMAVLITRGQQHRYVRVDPVLPHWRPRHHGLDGGSDHAWIDDNVFYVWISCLCIGSISVRVWMVTLIKRGSTTRLVSVDVVLPSENWRRVLRGAHGEGSRNAQGKLPACLDRHNWSCLRDKDLKLDKLSQFVLDESDKCLDMLDMRKDVRQIFIETPKKK